MLRAVRFAARLGFEIDPATEAAIRRLRDSVRAVSAERVRDELTRILTEGGARRGFEMLDETGLLDDRAARSRRHEGRRAAARVSSRRRRLDPHAHHARKTTRTRPPTLAWGVLLHDVGKPPTFRRRRPHPLRRPRRGRRPPWPPTFCRACAFPHDEIEQVVALVSNHMKFKDAPRMKQSTLKRFLRLPLFDEHLELHRLDCLSSHGHLENYDYVRAKLDEIPEEQLRPPRLLTGADLIAAGYVPGPPFAKMLDAAETAQLDGRVRTREEALALVEASFAKPSGEIKPGGT